MILLPNNKPSISRKTDVVGIIVAAFFLIISPLITPIFTPTPHLIYDYDSNLRAIEIQNTGSAKATGITIEIDPEQSTQLVGVIPSHLQGEPIINYSSDINGKSYYINHMYPKDILFFNLKFNKTLEKVPDNINVTIRSDQLVGTDAFTYFTNLLTYIQILYIVASLFIGFMLARLVYYSLRIPK